MNILFYLEPMIEQQNPYFRLGALKNTILKQAKELTDSGSTVSILTSKHVYEKALQEGVNFTDIQVVTIDVKEIIALIPNATASSRTNYSLSHTSNSESVEEYKTIIKNKLLGCNPDAIISWESPFDKLKEIYPNALHLHMMPGFFSRVPFPELTMIDPCGFFKKSSLSTNRKGIEDYQPSQKELELVEKIQDHFFHGYLQDCNPYSRQDLDPSGEFDSLVLLPLQVSGYFAFDAHTHHENQLDYLVEVLNTIPPTTGLVVTQYVTPNTKDTPVNSATIEYLRATYSNFIYKEEFNTIDGISQYLTTIVDGVVNVSSSIAFQAAFINKPVFSMGDSHTSIVSTPFSKNAISKLPYSVEHNNKLAYLLARRMPLTQQYVNGKNWLNTFIAKAITKRDQGTALHDIFDSIVEENHSYIDDFIKSGKRSVAIRKLENVEDKRIGQFAKKKLALSRILNQKDVEVISFDIFDTLIVRPFAKPTDLFRYIEDKVSTITNGAINNFKEVRVLAERELRQELIKANESREELMRQYEIKIADIYTTLAELTSYSDTNGLTKIMQLEIDTEIELLYPRNSGMDLYNAALKTGKKVIITSDMYLCEDTIVKILEKNNITGYHKLYLSSSIGKRKHEGHLFDYVLNNVGIKSKSLLHIGDNKHGDIASAEEYGIKTLHTTSTLNLAYENKAFSKNFFPKRNSATLAEGIAVGLCANRLFDDPAKPYWEDSLYNGSVFNFGYLGLGWMFFSYAKWVLEEAVEDGIDDLYFLARDGDIIKKVYDIISTHYDNAPKAHYIYASRRSAAVAALKTRADIEKLVSTTFHGGTLQKFFVDKLGYEISAEDQQELDNLNLSLSQKMTHKDKGVVSSLILSLSSKILASAAKEREYLIEYYQSVGLANKDKKVAVVDIGYAGSMQKAMLKMMDREKVGGYYFMTYESAQSLKKNGQIVKAFTENFVKPEHSSHPMCNLGLAYEVVFSNIEGSFLKMNKGLIPSLKSTEGENSKKGFIPEMQNGVIRFTKDIMNMFGSNIKDVYFDNTSSLQVWNKTLLEPTKQDAGLFEGLTFDDAFSGAELRYMVPPKSANLTPTELRKYSIWQEGTRAFYKKNNKPTRSTKPGKITSTLIKTLHGKESKKYKKFSRDPYSYLIDTKIPGIALIANRFI